jgi:hypothetical protein
MNLPPKSKAVEIMTPDQADAYTRSVYIGSSDYVPTHGPVGNVAVLFAISNQDTPDDVSVLIDKAFN